VAGRLDPWKRVDLAIAAAAAGKFPLVIAGDGADLARLDALARRSGADVRFTGRVPDDELLGLYATCGAVVFPPADEDYGYIALEAFLSRKPVVTCTDSGGPLEFVVDGENGRVVPPDGAALGAAVADLLENHRLASEFGERGFERVREIRWENAVRALLEAGGVL
jgi:glycosyltransferase involved in cell wall biosynthesis